MIENLYKDVSNPDLLKTCNTIVRLFDRSLNKMDLNDSITRVMDPKELIQNYQIKKSEKLFKELNLELKSWMIFLQGPEREQIIHADGNSEIRENLSNWALNIPLENCENSIMKWYGGKHLLRLIKSKTDDVNYLKIEWKEDPYIIVTKNITDPTIVNIKVPHRVKNFLNKTRKILSVRFKTDESLMAI